MFLILFSKSAFLVKKNSMDDRFNIFITSTGFYYTTGFEFMPRQERPDIKVSNILH